MADAEDYDRETLFETVREMVKSVLTAAKRKRLKAKQFALPGKRYPINDAAHARNALARGAQNASPAEQAAIRRKVKRKFPGIGMSKAEPLARIKGAQVLSMALCRRGKNGLRTLLKAEDDGSFELETLVKADGIAETGELHFVAYVPNMADADGWFAEPAMVKAMQRDFARNGFQLDIEHDGVALTADEAYVAESFVIQKSDPRFQNWQTYDGRTIDVTGAFGGVIQIDHPGLREAYASGELDGVSVFGRAAVEMLHKSSAAAPQEDMTPEQIKDLCKSVAESVVAALKPAPVETPKAEPDAPARPQFTGDPSDPTALEAFEKSLRAFELNQKLAKGELTAAQVAEMRKSLTEVGPTDEEAKIEAGDTAEVKDLKRRLCKASRRTNAPERGAPDAVRTQIELDLAEGRELAKSLSGGSVAASGWNVH